MPVHPVFMIQASVEGVDGGHGPAAIYVVNIFKLYNERT
jgi:hypothetical protein